MTNCSRIIGETEKRQTDKCCFCWSLCRISKIVMHKQRIQVLSFNAYSLSFLLVISIVYADKNLSSVDLASYFIQIREFDVFLHRKIQAHWRQLPGCSRRVYWLTPKTQFGDLRGFYSADKKVPAEEIKIDCRGLVCAKAPRIAPEKSELQRWRNRWKRADGERRRNSRFCRSIRMIGWHKSHLVIMS